MAFIFGSNIINWLFGTSGSDLMVGNQDYDFLDGKDGNDILAGLRGNDDMIGGYGNDILLGGSGNDLLDGGAGIDRMIGGSGNDVYYYDNPYDRIIENRFGGTDEVRAWISATLPDQVENLTLLESATNGTGNGLDNRIVGNDSANTLSGLAGEDVLQGGGGDDLLIGGTGRDTLFGGTGADVFDFSRGCGRDTIEDFSIAEGDRIRIDAGMGWSVRDDRAGNAVVRFGLTDDVTLVGVSSRSVSSALFTVG
ncbi:calcium-binding protein [Azospirillum sp. RWY-5-1]|uniref:Calcium-binding protein n=1 Tax=Azospirillum oleiclasticum TaxID=2735135 RepID=A0ABX2TG10_9PROT|nr:calcium-binding protein [Azospirillum oleiclasticum]NYZ14136.1 calcium-binding protein [Azospirillum oleiclasticum]NYZ21620.1 calcium-binding protein [Azospirillum oleiclasticum]